MGNYLHFSIELRYKIVCNNNALGVNYHFNSIFEIDATYNKALATPTLTQPHALFSTYDYFLIFY